VQAGEEVEIAAAADEPAATTLVSHPRAGWAADSKAVAEAGDDRLVWPEFGNEEDKTWEW